MKQPLGKDDGKEAFAYLAILLMVSSMTFAAYAGFIESDQRRIEEESLQIERLNSDILNLKRSIRSDLSMAVDESFSRIERELILNATGDGIEIRLHDDLAGNIPTMAQRRTDDMNGSGRGALVSIEGLSIDIIPRFNAVDGVIPSTEPSYDNVSGLIEIGSKCEILSVMIILEIMLGIESSNGGYTRSDTLHVEIEKQTFSEFLRRRQVRLEEAVESGEFGRIFSYLMTSLIQQKAIMGYGREITPGDSGYSGPLITDAEIETLADLSMALLAQSHLRCTDSEFMDRISTNISNFPGAGGSTVPVNRSMEGITDPYDPAGLVLLAAGYGSEDNPPSLDTIIRPLILSVVDRLVSKFQIYTGNLNSSLAVIGGLMEVYRLAVDVFDEGLEVLGVDIVEDSKLTAWDMFSDLLESGGFNITNGISLMNRELEGYSFGGDEIRHYPLVDLGSVERTFDVYLTEDSPDRIYFTDGDGNRHSAGEYTRPDDVYYAHECEVYRLTVSYRLQEMEPAFQSILLDYEEEFKNSLLSLLGTDDEDLELRSDRLARQGEIELKNALEKTISELSGGLNGDLWDEMYCGWNESTYPSPEDGIHPLREYLSFNTDALKSFMTPLVNNLQEGLISGDYPDLLSEYSDSWGELIAVWLNDTYDIWSGKDRQLISTRDDFIPKYLMGCSAEVVDWEVLGPRFIEEDEAVFPPGGPDDIGWLSGDRDLLVEKGLTDDTGTPGGEELSHLVEMKLYDSFDMIKDRECSMEPGKLGVISGALLGSGTRGSGSLFDGIWDMSVGKAADYIFEVINGTYSLISLNMLKPYGMTGNMNFMAPPPRRNTITPRSWQGADVGGIGSFRVDSSINRSERCIIKKTFSGGEYDTDFASMNSSYRSFMSISVRSAYHVGYRAEGEGSSGLDECVSDPDVNVTVDLEIDTPWPMEGVVYSPTRTLWDDILDNGKRAAIIVLQNLSVVAEEYLGGTMGSVAELPPVLLDMLNGEDIDMTEVSRVLTNISMELSGKIREGIKGIVKQLIETGISITIAEVLKAFKIDIVEGSLSYGGLTLDLRSEVEALTGSEGMLLLMGFGIPSLGTVGSMEISRGENGTLGFNGTIRIDIGGLHIRIEIDPFMDVRPHILSIGGKLERGGKLLRFSVLFPDVDVYRSSEISLGSSLGISPMVFIPPIGMSAVFDGGFRIRYMTPSELKPHLNELNFIDGELTGIEIFNPLGMSVGGYTLEIRTMDNRQVSTEYIYGGNEVHEWIEMDASINVEHEGLIFMLRDPSGRIADDVAVVGYEEGYFSRESDGWGVWRWCGGSPGEPNGRTGQFSFTSLLLNIVVSSLREAWDEAYSMYGLTFQTLTHFVERAIDLFVERALSAVGELVLDVRMFVDIKIAAGAGVSAGFGIEIAFMAEGDAVAKFLNWVYENVKIFLGNIMNPGGAGDYTRFPLEILSDCYIEAAFFFEIETPPALSKLAPEGADIPTSLNIGVSGRMSLSLPLILAGVDIEGWEISAGVYVVDAPASLISMFYELPAVTGQVDLWILRAAVWCE